MRIVTVKKLLEAAKEHPGSEKRVHAFLHLIKHQVWQGPADVKAFDCKASFVGKLVVFDMGSDRLVVKIRYASTPHQTSSPIYFQHLFSHEEYDRWGRDRARS